MRLNLDYFPEDAINDVTVFFNSLKQQQIILTEPFNLRTS
jgi:hypothetical protein